MKRQKSQKIFFILFWILTVIITSIWSYENHDKLEAIKSYFLKNKKPKVKANTEEVFVRVANSFSGRSFKNDFFIRKNSFRCF